MHVFLFTFFFHCLSFSPLVAASISHFLTAAIKFSCFSSNEIRLFFFYISRFSSFFVIHVNVDIRFGRKKDSALLLFFSL